MKTIVNKTHRPIKIQLSRARVLRLGPGKEGQIATQDAERESLKKLVADGDVEIFDDQSPVGSNTGTTSGRRSSARGHHPKFSVVKRGDR